MSDTKPRKADFQAPRGTRDFYPEHMARLNWLFDHWRQVSRRHGFEEYEGPLYEHLELYTVKSGEGIVSELFSFQDRGERDLAIRPEITPTLARMIAAKAAALPRPIKWFSMPRACRAERPQRGRLREFFQWNVDVLGSESVLADAECIFVMLDFLRTVGLGPDLVEVQVNSRTIVGALLEQEGVSPDRHERVFTVMDRYQKLEPDAFREFVLSQGFTDVDFDLITRIIRIPDLDAMKDLVKSDPAKCEFDRLNELKGYLDHFGVGDYFRYRADVVRGLAYYTGIVFEVFDRGSKLRAIAGGGRYDNLIRLFNGPDMPAVGFGMGDPVLMELLADLKLLPETDGAQGPQVFVIDADAEMFQTALEMVGRLRMRGIAAEMSYKRQAVGKQFKQAASRCARTAVVLGRETREQKLLTIKNLDDGTQSQVDLEKFLEDPAAFVGG